MNTELLSPITESFQVLGRIKPQRHKIQKKGGKVFRSPQIEAKRRLFAENLQKGILDFTLYRC